MAEYLTLILGSPYKHLSCDCHTQLKCNTAIMLGPIWYVVSCCWCSIMSHMGSRSLFLLLK